MELFQELFQIIVIATEIVLIGVVSRREVAHRIPAFLFYLYWAALGDLADAVYYYSGFKGFMTAAHVQVACEGLAILAVLFDLVRSAIRPLPIVISRGLFGLLGIVTAAAGAALWRFTDSWALLPQYRDWHIFLREQLTLSILRIFLLLLIGGLVEFLSRYRLPLGWGGRELQIITGMGVYALASLAEALTSTYQHTLRPIVFQAIHASVIVTYEICLVYWIVCFLRPDPVRADQKTETMDAPPDSGPSTLWHKELTEF